jgi:hypothetical protein
VQVQQRQHLGDLRGLTAPRRQDRRGNRVAALFTRIALEPSDPAAAVELRDLAVTADPDIRRRAIAELAALRPERATLEFLLDRAVADEVREVRLAATRGGDHPRRAAVDVPIAASMILHPRPPRWLPRGCRCRTNS